MINKLSLICDGYFLLEGRKLRLKKTLYFKTQRIRQTDKLYEWIFGFF
jgi:hypothetical protein